jgi:tetratricopeptide (TPR) repeat protein
VGEQSSKSAVERPHDSGDPSWVTQLRSFIATGEPDHLNSAANSCADPSAKQFLQLSWVDIDPREYRDWTTAAKHLLDEERTAEAAVIELLSLRKAAQLADTPEMLDEDGARITLSLCTRAAILSHEQGFTECEATFVLTLGVRSMKMRAWREAYDLVSRAVELYQEVADRDALSYESYLALAHSNCGEVLRQLKEYGAARESHESAVQHFRSLSLRDPVKHHRFLASSLNNLGIVLLETRNLEAARSAYEEALAINRELATQDELTQLPELAMSLLNLGNLFHEMRDSWAAFELLDEAVSIYGTLANRDSKLYARDLAGALNNLGEVQRYQRDHEAARRTFVRSLEMLRTHSGRTLQSRDSYRAGVCNNLGLILIEQERYTEAIDVLRESLRIRMANVRHDRRSGQPDYTATLHNVGLAFLKQGDLKQASRYFTRAVKNYERLCLKEPGVYCAQLAGSLSNLGVVLEREGRLEHARSMWHRATEFLQPKARKEPCVYGADLSAALNNFAGLLAKLGDSHTAYKMARDAVELAEDCSKDPDVRWLTKGRAAGAYRQFASELAAQDDSRGVFRCLSAMREGRVQALGIAPGDSLDAAAEGLREAGDRVEQRIAFLIPQGLANSEMLLTFLAPGRSRAFCSFRSDGFSKLGSKLFNEILTVFDREDERTSNHRRKEVARLGAEAWATLPEPVQELLCPTSGYEVLISGDPYWAAFPWEALRIGDGEQDWLGLQRPLARWGPLTATSTQAITRDAFGSGDPTAAIVCPWNASTNPQEHLLFAREEATKLTSALRDTGYRLLPSGTALLGQAAQPKALSPLLRQSPSVIHYTGHGAIIDNEEVLVLHGGNNERPYTFFGRREIAILKSRLGCSRLLPQRPLLVLNSCRTGRTRDFGGQREDLAWQLLVEGAGAVIASALPVFDTMGSVFGEALYSPLFASPAGMGQTLVEVRRFLESATRSRRVWPSWSLLTYHGNPFARLPLAKIEDATPDTPGRLSFLERLAEWLGLRDASAAAEFIGRIKR